MTAIAIAFPVIGSLLAILVRSRDARRAVRVIMAALAAVLPFALASSIDQLSLIFVAIISILAFLATIYSTDMFAINWIGGDVFWSRKAVYFVLLGGFWSAMLLVVLAHDFATLWFGISATTLATAFLVGFSGEDAALEAAWKYLVLCSLGIGVALIGIILLAHGSLAAGSTPAAALNWSAIAALHGHREGAVRLATALMAIGFATKAGVFPLHAWLPDAHSKAPTPISGLLSGVLVSCALYAIVRTLQVADAWGDGATLHGMLTWFGAVSIVAAGLLMLVQRDLKRLLAYSTVEHAGIVVLALGVGGVLGTTAALLHVLGHAFCKAGAFFAVGIVQREYGAGTGWRLWTRTPAGRLLLLAFTGLAGLPPFGLFWSEVLLALAAIEARAWIPLALAAAGVVLAFAALARAALQVEPTRQRKLEGSPAQSGLSLRLSFISAAAALGLSALAFLIPWTGVAGVLGAIARGVR